MNGDKDSRAPAARERIIPVLPSLSLCGKSSFERKGQVSGQLTTATRHVVIERQRGGCHAGFPDRRQPRPSLRREAAQIRLAEECAEDRPHLSAGGFRQGTWQGGGR